MEGRNGPYGAMLPWRSPFSEGNNCQGFLISWKESREIIRPQAHVRYYDLVLPKDARVFMTDMTGPTNCYKIVYYYWVTYYLFPREVGTSLDHITRLTNDGFLGRTSESNHEIFSNGFDVRIDITSDDCEYQTS